MLTTERETISEPAVEGAAARRSRAAIRAQKFHYPISMVPGAIAALDIFIILMCAWATCNHLVILTEDTNDQYLFASVFISFVTVILFQRAELYDISALMRPLRNSDTVFAALCTAFLFFLSIVYALKSTDTFDSYWLFAFWASSLGAVAAARIATYLALKRLGAAQMIGRNFVILGAGEQAHRFLARIDRAKPYFTTVLGVYADEREGASPTVGGYPFIGDTQRLLADVRAGKIDDVVVAMPWNADKELTRTVELLKELPINVHISSDLVGFRLRFRPVIGSGSQLSMFEVEQRPIAGWSSLLKSLEDYLLAGLCLVLLSPLLLLIAIAIKLDDGGRIFFMQQRLGFNNKLFEIYKFRSMHETGEPEREVRQATKSDPRVTRVGKFLRKTSLDELPQLLNVMNGSMSLVGPRPHAISHNEHYGPQIRGYFARHRVKPGITGWAQVNGLRGQTEELGEMEARIEHDVYYTDNWSLLFDMRILMGTALVMLFQRSAY